MTNPLEVLKNPDLVEVWARYQRAKAKAAEVAEWAWIGALVSEFSNEELRMLAEQWSIDETLKMRRLGLLGADEGYDGRRKPKVSADTSSTPEPVVDLMAALEKSLEKIKRTPVEPGRGVSPDGD